MNIWLIVKGIFKVILLLMNARKEKNKEIKEKLINASNQISKGIADNNPSDIISGFNAINRRV